MLVLFTREKVDPGRAVPDSGVEKHNCRYSVGEEEAEFG